MKTKVYSVFPACGKTWLYEHQEDFCLKILDLDSSQFNWIIEEVEDPDCVLIGDGGIEPLIHKNKVRNPDFPNNYIKHIKENLGKYDYIFVSSHASVRDVLDEEGIDFTIVYPEMDCKAEWVGRCFIREKNEEKGCSAEVMYKNWEQWVVECFQAGIDHEEIILHSKEHLSDYFKK